jgi:hypothetical protein
MTTNKATSIAFEKERDIGFFELLRVRRPGAAFVFAALFLNDVKIILR